VGLLARIDKRPKKGGLHTQVIGKGGRKCKNEGFWKPVGCLSTPKGKRKEKRRNKQTEADDKNRETRTRNDRKSKVRH